MSQATRSATIKITHTYGFCTYGNVVAGDGRVVHTTEPVPYKFNEAAWNRAETWAEKNGYRIPRAGD